MASCFEISFPSLLVNDGLVGQPSTDISLLRHIVIYGSTDGMGASLKRARVKVHQSDQNLHDLLVNDHISNAVWLTTSKLLAKGGEHKS